MTPHLSRGSYLNGIRLAESLYSTKLLGCGKTISGQRNFEGLHIWDRRARRAGLVKQAGEIPSAHVAVFAHFPNVSPGRAATTPTVCHNPRENFDKRRSALSSAPSGTVATGFGHSSVSEWLK